MIKVYIQGRSQDNPRGRAKSPEEMELFWGFVDEKYLKASPFYGAPLVGLVSVGITCYLTWIIFRWMIEGEDITLQIVGDVGM